MIRLISFLALFVANVALADAPVIWYGTTAKWLPAGMQSAGLNKQDASGVITPYTTNGIVKMSSGVPGAALAGTDYQSPITIATFGSSPNNDGLTFSSNTLNLEPADATHPGGVSTGAQTIAGAKTFSSTIVGSINGNAGTATALAANPADCSANQFANAIAANGDLTCAQVGDSALSTSYIKADGSRGLSGNWNAGSFNITASTFIGALTGNADTATALAANPTDCSAGTFANAIAANGNLTCATPSGTATLTTKGDLFTFDSANARLPIGTNNQLLVPDSAQTLGLKWTTALPTAAVPAFSGGDVTSAGGSLTLTIANDAVTNAKLANMANATFKCRTTSGTGDPEDCTATQSTALLNTMVGDSGSGGTKGLAGAPASGDAAAGKFWKADGTWAVPSSSGSTAVTKSITQSTHGFAVGDVIYYTGSAYAKAKADANSTSDALGVVSTVTDTDNFTVTTSGYISGLSGLTAGSSFFLSAATAGALTATEPSTVGYVSKPILIADSTTSGYVIHSRGVVIGAGTAIPAQLWVGGIQNGSGSIYYERASASIGDFTKNGSPTLTEIRNDSFGTVTLNSTLPGVDFTAPATGTLVVEATAEVMTGTSGQGSLILLTDGSDTVLRRSSAYASSTNGTNSKTLIGFMNVTAAGSYTVKLRSFPTSGSVFLGPSSVLTDILSFSIRYVK